LFNKVSFGCIDGGKAIQILHIGSYDTEPASFEKMDKLTKELGVFSFGFANSRYQQKDLNQTLLKLCKNPQTRSLVDYKMIMASYFPNDKPLAIMIVEHLNCRQLIKNGRVSIQYRRY